MELGFGTRVRSRFFKTSVVLFGVQVCLANPRTAATGIGVLVEKKSSVTSSLLALVTPRETVGVQHFVLVWAFSLLNPTPQLIVLAKSGACISHQDSVRLQYSDVLV